MKEPIIFDLCGIPLNVDMVEQILSYMNKYGEEFVTNPELAPPIQLVGYRNNNSGIKFIGSLTKELFGINIPIPEEKPSELKLGGFVKTSRGLKQISKIRQTEDNPDLYLLNVKDIKSNNQNE
jgi:hypothetical protein